MKASEVISRLAKLIQEHGDRKVDIVLSTGEMSFAPFEEVEGLPLSVVINRESCNFEIYGE